MVSGQSRRGFTLVELLIVIVVIAVLAAITVVAMQADLSQVETKLGTYFVDNGNYPALLSDAGIKDSGGVTYYYTYDKHYQSI